MTNTKDYQGIIDIASKPIVRLFREEAEQMVRHHFCKDKPCEKLCRQARQHVVMIVKFCWLEYARLN